MSDQQPSKSADEPYGPPFTQPPSQPYPAPPPGNSGQAPPPIGQPRPTGNYIPPTPGAQPLSVADERLWAMLAFLLSIIAGFLAPLVIYLVFRDRSQFVRAASREALNLQITAIIVGLGAMVGMGIVGLVAVVAFPPLGLIILLGWFLIAIGYSVAVLVFEIIGAMRANSGEVYRVPYILRLVKN
jgi:uncharacterized protein